MLFDEAIRSGNLSQGDLAVVDFVSKHPHDVLQMTSQELGAAAYVSASTVTRLCKKAGFKSFADMKVRLARDLADEESFQHVDSDFPQLANATSEQVIGTISSMEREAIRKTERLLASVDWSPILRAMDEADGISVYAVGFSRAACETFVTNLTRIGKRVTMPDIANLSIQWASCCPRDEFSILISYSGSGAYITQPAELLRRRGLKSLSITSDYNCPLRSLTTWNLPLALMERHQAYNRTAPFQSTIAEAFALDTLYAQLFARNHARNADVITRSLLLQGTKVMTRRS